MAYISKKKRQQVYNKYDGHCAYCGKEIEYKDMQVDHLEPQSNNTPIGRDINNDFVYPDIHALPNLMPSCRRCNHYKRAHSLDYFRGMIDTLHERITHQYIAKVALDYGVMQFHEFDGLFYFEKIERGLTKPA
jgi:hypothetical protein